MSHENICRAKSQNVVRKSVQEIRITLYVLRKSLKTKIGSNIAAFENERCFMYLKNRSELTFSFQNLPKMEKLENWIGEKDYRLRKKLWQKSYFGW